MPPVKLIRSRGWTNEETDRSFLRRLILQRSKGHAPWILLNLVFAVVLVLDVWLGEFSLSKHLLGSDWFRVGWVVEVLVVCGATVNLLSALLIVLWPYISQRTIPVTPRQRQLLGIKENESGFKTVSPALSPVLTGERWKKLGVGKIVNLDWLFHLKKRYSPNSERRSSADTVRPLSQPNWTASYSPGQQTPNWSRDTTPVSPESYATPSRVSSFGSGDQSSYLDNSDWLGHSERKPTFAESIMRMRRAKSSSPFLEGKTIHSKEGLRRYLDEFERKSEQMNRTVAAFPLNLGQTTYELGYMDSVSPVSEIFGELSGTSRDATTKNSAFEQYSYVKDGVPVPILKKTDSKASREMSFSHSRGSVQSLWMRFDLDSDNLDGYTQNLRSWISRTILKPIVREIDKLNSAQSRQDLKIGDASLASLRHVLLLRPTECEGLRMLIPYLELTSSQQYMVQRIRDLARDACMCEFKWNSGGQERVGAVGDQTRPWDDHLPTDAKMIWHLLSTYLDSKLPANPLCSDSKNFTSQYFLAYPGKVKDGDLRKALSAVYIYQKTESPPHFTLVISGGAETVDVGPGRNNLLLTILLFFQCLKMSWDGYLGPVSLGSAGLNVLWTLEE